MFYKLWNSGPFGHILADVLLASSILIALYLLFIAYRKFLTYLGLGRLKQTTVKYATVYDLRPPYAKGKVQFGYELGEETEVKFQLIDKNEKLMKLFVEEKEAEGIYPVYLDTTEFPNGEYFYQLITPYQKVTKKFFIVN